MDEIYGSIFLIAQLRMEKVKEKIVLAKVGDRELTKEDMIAIMNQLMS